MTKRAPLSRGRHRRWRVLASWLDGTEATARAFYAQYNTGVDDVDPDEMIDVKPRQRKREVSNG